MVSWLAVGCSGTSDALALLDVEVATSVPPTNRLEFSVVDHPNIPHRSVTGDPPPNHLLFGYYLSGVSGTITIRSQAIDGAGCSIGEGTATMDGVQAGQRTPVAALVIAALSSPTCAGDGGVARDAPDDASSDARPNLDGNGEAGGAGGAGGGGGGSAGTEGGAPPFLTKLTSPTTQAFHKIWGSGASDVYITGDNDVVLHSTGNGMWLNWSPTAQGTRVVYQGIWGSSAADVYVPCATGTGASPKIYRSATANGVWTSVALSTEIEAIWGSGPGDVFAVGVSGTILHSTGDNIWTPEASGTSNVLMDVWGTSSGNVYAVGYAGTIVHFNGASWAAQTSGSDQNFVSVWGSGPADIYATAADGTVLHSTGNGVWVAQSTGATVLGTRIWGSEAADVYAVGSPSASSTGILHSVGNGEWTQVAPGIIIRDLRAAWGSGANDVYFADYAGGIYHHPQPRAPRADAGLARPRSSPRRQDRHETERPC